MLNNNNNNTNNPNESLLSIQTSSQFKAFLFLHGLTTIEEFFNSKLTTVDFYKWEELQMQKFLKKPQNKDIEKLNTDEANDKFTSYLWQHVFCKA